MWIGKKKLNKMLADARSEGFNRGYLMAEGNWKLFISKLPAETSRSLQPQVLLEAEAILRSKSDK